MDFVSELSSLSNVRDVARLSQICINIIFSLIKDNSKLLWETATPIVCRPLTDDY